MAFNPAVVIVCAGKGQRLKNQDKASLVLADKPIFYHSFDAFADFGQIKEIVLVLRKAHFGLAKMFIKDKRLKLVEGGEERKDSVHNGLSALSKKISHVFIHDAARPFVDKKLISKMLAELKKHPALIAAMPSVDTVKLVKNKNVKETLERKKIFLAQTPQGFEKKLILKAYKKFGKEKFTDDSSMVEALGETVKVVESSPDNFKITHPQDLKIAKLLFEGSFCVGFGFDVHRITQRKGDFILGGVKIPCKYSIEAVSDGDVILHALSDAIAGPACLGDIGDYFLPHSYTSKDIDSKKILKFILEKIQDKFSIENVDIVIAADKPPLKEHKAKIVKSLKKLLSLEDVNLKVKSKEGLEILGPKKSISCFVNLLMKRK